MRSGTSGRRRVGRRWWAAAGLALAGLSAGLALGQTGPATPTAPAPAGPAATGDYGQRVVAYIHGTIPVTREELGEYLIVRYGAEKLQLLVNKKIIDHYCAQHGISVSAGEIEAAFAEDIKGIGVSKADFVKKVLEPHNQTLYEWKEDVLRPRLLLRKICEARIQVSEEDLKLAFDAHYGQKVDCRLILIPPESGRVAHQIYAHARQSEEAFLEEARKQANSTLAASGGQITPISRSLPGTDPLLEKEAFSLKPGDTSRLIETPQGQIIMRCIKIIPPDSSKDFEKEKPALQHEVFERKLSVEIPKAFKTMQDEAKPTYILKRGSESAEALKENVRRELSEPLPALPGAPPATPPMK